MTMLFSAHKNVKDNVRYNIGITQTLQSLNLSDYFASTESSGEVVTL